MYLEICEMVEPKVMESDDGWALSKKIYYDKKVYNTPFLTKGGVPRSSPPHIQHKSMCSTTFSNTTTWRKLVRCNCAS